MTKEQLHQNLLGRIARLLPDRVLPHTWPERAKDAQDGIPYEIVAVYLVGDRVFVDCRVGPNKNLENDPRHKTLETGLPLSWLRVEDL